MADAQNTPQDKTVRAAVFAMSAAATGWSWGSFNAWMIANQTPTLFGVPVGEPDDKTKWLIFLLSGLLSLWVGTMAYHALQFIYGLTRK
jgi:hypothetical protein